MARQGGGSADPGDPGWQGFAFWRRRQRAEAEAREARAAAVQAEALLAEARAAQAAAEQETRAAGEAAKAGVAQAERAAREQVDAARQERDEAVAGAPSRAAGAESRAAEAGQDTARACARTVHHASGKASGRSSSRWGRCDLCGGPAPRLLTGRPAGFHNPAMASDLRFQAAVSYRLMSPPRTGRGPVDVGSCRGPVRGQVIAGAVDAAAALGMCPRAFGRPPNVGVDRLDALLSQPVLGWMSVGVNPEISSSDRL